MKLALELGEQVWGPWVDVELELHGAAQQIPDLDLHRTALLQREREEENIQQHQEYMKVLKHLASFKHLCENITAQYLLFTDQHVIANKQ